MTFSITTLSKKHKCYADCRPFDCYADWPYAKRRYAECRGANCTDDKRGNIEKEVDSYFSYFYFCFHFFFVKTLFQTSLS
jgi:hypothetical protein